MKKILVVLAILFSLNTFCQTTTPEQSSDKIVSKTLYTKKERKSARKDFLRDVDSLGLTPEVKTQYLDIIQKNVTRMKATNNDNNLTQEQAIQITRDVFRQQNDEVSRILTPDQYRKHMTIVKRYEESIIYRIGSL